MFKITYNIITITRSDITMIRRHYLFYGRVQEVGFRFTTYHLAKKLGLTGRVCNLSNGAVEACFQGEEKVIDYLINDLKHTQFININKIECENLKVLKYENDFGIKY